MKTNIRFFTILISVICFECQLHAQEIRTGSTPNPTGSGAHAMGMGNAFIGFSDDATAASWNPAGLLQLDRVEFSFAVDAFSRTGDLNDALNHPESNSSESTEDFDVNFLSFVIPISWKQGPINRMALSLNYLKQFRFDQELNFNLRQDFPDSGVRDIQYDVDQEGSFTTLSSAIAIEINPAFSIGLTFNIWNDDITGASSFKRKELSLGTTQTNIPGFPSSTDGVNFLQNNEFTVDEGYSLQLGVMWSLDQQDRWRIGLIYKPEFILDLDHDIFVFDGVNNSVDVNTQKPAELKMPTILGVGVLYNPNENWFFTADAIWTDWSAHNLRERNSVGQKENTNPITARPQSEGRLSDTYTFRFGLEHRNYLTNPGEESVRFIPINFGLGFDPVPAVGGADYVLTVSAGSGYVRDNWRFNIAYEFRHGNRVFAFVIPEDTEFREDIRQHRVMASMVYMFR